MCVCGGGGCWRIEQKEKEKELTDMTTVVIAQETGAGGGR